MAQTKRTEQGFTPRLWIGFTSTCKNKLSKAVLLYDVHYVRNLYFYISKERKEEWKGEDNIKNSKIWWLKTHWVISHWHVRASIRILELSKVHLTLLSCTMFNTLEFADHHERDDFFYFYLLQMTRIKISWYDNASAPSRMKAAAEGVFPRLLPRSSKMFQ